MSRALLERLEARGGRLGERAGRRALLDHGDVAGEAAALREGAGLLVRLDRARLVVSGGDAVDYLHRMLTQDVAGLAAGTLAPACLLTNKGRILGHLLVLRRDGDLLLDLDGGDRERVAATLERYVIADDVEIADASDAWVRAALVGPAAGSVLEAAGLPIPGADAFLESEGLLVARHDLGTRPAYELALAADGAGERLEGLLAREDVRAVGELALDVLRVEELVPTAGVELDERIMPLEARLGESAIAWGKGCFPGQEPVVMARHRGRPPTLLVRLAPLRGEVPAAGAELFCEGRPAGRVTTIVPDDALPGEAACLGFVRTALVEAGATLTTEGGTRLRLDPA